MERTEKAIRGIAKSQKLVDDVVWWLGQPMGKHWCPTTRKNTIGGADCKNLCHRLWPDLNKGALPNADFCPCNNGKPVAEVFSEVVKQFLKDALDREAKRKAEEERITAYFIGGTWDGRKTTVAIPVLDVYKVMVYPDPMAYHPVHNPRPIFDFPVKEEVYKLGGFPQMEGIVVYVLSGMHRNEALRRLLRSYATTER